MVRKFLVSGVMTDDEYEDTVVGTPQGGNFSYYISKVNDLPSGRKKPLLGRPIFYAYILLHPTAFEPSKKARPPPGRTATTRLYYVKILCGGKIENSNELYYDWQRWYDVVVLNVDKIDR